MIWSGLPRSSVLPFWYSFCLNTFEVLGQMEWMIQLLHFPCFLQRIGQDQIVLGLGKALDPCEIQGWECRQMFLWVWPNQCQAFCRPWYMYGWWTGMLQSWNETFLIKKARKKNTKFGRITIPGVVILKCDIFNKKARKEKIYLFILPANYSIIWNEKYSQ